MKQHKNSSLTQDTRILNNSNALIWQSQILECQKAVLYSFRGLRERGEGNTPFLFCANKRFCETRKYP